MTSYLQNNLQLLNQTHPQLAREILNTIVPSDRYRLEKGKTGLPTVCYVSPEGQEILFHSRYDPKREAEKIVSGYQVSSSTNLAVMGFGLGYHILEIIQRGTLADFILICEKNREVLRIAFEVMDLSPVLKLPFVKWTVGEEAFESNYLLREHALNLIANGMSIVVHPPSLSLAKEYYATVKESLEKFYRYSKVNTNTQIQMAEQFVRNGFENIKEFVAAHPVSDLFGIAKGFPVYVVGAGPSLDKTAHLLKKVGRKGFIIAVDSAVKTLQSWDIPIDLIVSIDFTDHALKYFKNISGGEAALVFDMEICPEIPRTFKGRKFAIHLPYKSVSEFVRSAIGDKGTIPKGLSVSHAAVQLAAKMEASEIILVGQDLAYPHSHWHTKNSSFYQMLDVADDREVAMSEVEDIFGGMLKTAGDLMIFKNHFEGIFAELPISCYDATEGGAKIKGTQVISLSDCIQRFSLTLERERERIPFSQHSQDLFGSVYQNVSEVHEKCIRLNHACFQIVQLLDKIESSFQQTGDRDVVLKGFRQVRSLSIIMDEEKEVINLLKDASTEALIIRAKKNPVRFDNLQQVSDQLILEKIKQEKYFFQILLNSSDMVSNKMVDFLKRYKWQVAV